MEKGIKLSAIANIKVLEKFQRLFLKLTGIYVTFIDTSGEFITSDRGLRPFCLYLARLKFKGNCDRCNLEHIQEAVKLKRPIVYECFAGLTEILSPIVVDRRVVGAVLAGQIRTEGQKLRLDSFSDVSASELRKLKQLYSQVPEFTEEQVNSIAELFFSLVNYIFEIEFEILSYKQLEEPVDRKEKIVKQVMNMINQNFADTNLSVEFIAEKLNISKYYLCHIFRDKTGFSIKGFIKRVRLKKTVELLKDPKVPIKEIPYRVGFRDVYYFYRVFRREFNMTPLVFRRRYFAQAREQKSTKAKQKFILNTENKFSRNLVRELQF